MKLLLRKFNKFKKSVLEAKQNSTKQKHSEEIFPSDDRKMITQQKTVGSKFDNYVV